MNFMQTSLEKLVGNLERLKFKHTGKYFKGEELDLMLRKGVYPYEYMTGAERLCEKSLLPKEEFASLLGEGVISDSKAMIMPSQISDENYQHAQKVFEAFGCENLADYTELYCKSDVLLLVRRSPTASQTFSYTSTYTSFIQYLDANNLYGWAMSQSLPAGNFQWLDEDDIYTYTKYPEWIRSGTLEVNLEYPRELHDLHNDYPLAPENVKVNGTRKLIPHLGSRKNYVLHHKTLHQCLKYGMKLVKIHRSIRYRESKFLEKYIVSNTESRMVAKNEFEKDFFTLMDNSVFGKTMENVRDRSKIKIVNYQETE